MQDAVGNREKWRLALATVAVVAVDQFVKWIVSSFPEGKVIGDLWPLFQVVRTQNSGAAFSMLMAFDPSRDTPQSARTFSSGTHRP